MLLARSEDQDEQRFQVAYPPNEGFGGDGGGGTGRSRTMSTPSPAAKIQDIRHPSEACTVSFAWMSDSFGLLLLKGK
ncbi:MAG: hypothetical protein ACXV74_02435 [Methylobacter sp.]